MAKTPQQDWSSEFRELGKDRVRSLLPSNDWSREKKAAARIWIETADALAWQQKRGDGESKRPLMLRVRTSKWWRYGAPAFATLMGIGMLLRRLKAF